MSQVIKWISLFLVVLAISAGSLYADPLVLHNVNVLILDNDRIAEQQTIIIQDGYITWVGDAGNAVIPDNATIVEGDFYVMPGLAEMHAHIPSSNQGTDAMENALALYLAHGITTIRGMLGQEAHLDLRERADAGEIFSPRILTSGPSFSGNSVNNPEQARQMVRNQHEAGYDLLKFHPGLTLENFQAITEEANSLGIEFSGHISHAIGLERSLEAGKGSIDHLDRYMEYLAGNPADREDPPIIYFGYDLAPVADRGKIAEAATITREAGVWNVPTNTLLDNIFNPDNSVEEMLEWPGMEFIPESTLENWANFVTQMRNSEVYDETQSRNFLDIRNELTKALHDHNAGLLLGADAPQIFNPPGYSTHRELKLLVDAGLSPIEAIKTGTINVGKYLGEEHLTGKIAEGFKADLILLSANPLESIPFHDKIEAVVSQGVYYNRADLDEKLEKVRNSVQ